MTRKVSGRTLSEAPQFYAAYSVCVAAAAGLVLIPGAPLQTIILGVQVLAGVMLPSAIILALMALFVGKARSPLPRVSSRLT